MDIQATIKKIEEKHSTQSAKRYRVTCGVCGKEFISDSYKLIQFCNEKCRKEYLEQEENRIRQERENRAEREILWIIPKKYQTIETDKTDLLAQSIGHSVFITGGVGTGKTVFAASLAKYYIRKYIKVVWVCYPNFIMKLQNQYGKQNAEETAYDIAETIALEPGYLIVDDLGAEKLTEFVRQTTYYILNTREQNCLPTIITSNFSLSGIDDQIDERVSSRICGMCKVLKFQGKDRRQY